MITEIIQPILSSWCGVCPNLTMYVPETEPIIALEPFSFTEALLSPSFSYLFSVSFSIGICFSTLLLQGELLRDKYALRRHLSASQAVGTFLVFISCCRFNEFKTLDDLYLLMQDYAIPEGLIILSFVTLITAVLNNFVLAVTGGKSLKVSLELLSSALNLVVMGSLIVHVSYASYLIKGCKNFKKYKNMKNLQNENPQIFSAALSERIDNLNDDKIDEIDSLEIFDLVKNINDPEHPLTLQQLNVIRPDLITVENNKVIIKFVPTIPHCSMATLIGLSIKVCLIRVLPRTYKVRVEIEKGTHQSEDAVNRQLNDKERVCAALENPHLLKAVNTALKRTLVEV